MPRRDLLPPSLPPCSRPNGLRLRQTQEQRQRQEQQQEQRQQQQHPEYPPAEGYVGQNLACPIITILYNTKTPPKNAAPPRPTFPPRPIRLTTDITPAQFTFVTALDILDSVDLTAKSVRVQPH